MQLVAADTRRVTVTPNATMTTLASPTLGSAGSSLWLVEMNPDATGPVHAFAEEVVWAITRGAATLHADGGERLLGPGDTVVLPGGSMRQFDAGADGFTAIATTSGTGHVTRADAGPAGTPPWVT
ncbi:MAG: AraC family ligand binding domain-containing protein [Nocardioides sp.]